MNLTLLRHDFLSTGIFGTLYNSDKSLYLSTGEHSYSISPDPMSLSTNYSPKVPSGSYLCVLGTHQLEPTELNPKPQPFKTYQITDVPGHKNILFHKGNWPQTDSIGCILLGLSRSGDMLQHSGDAFTKFIEAQCGLDSFSLTIL